MRISTTPASANTAVDTAVGYATSTHFFLLCHGNSIK